MPMDFSGIISADDLKNFENVKEKAKQQEELYIFENNRPTHVLMRIEQFEQMFGKTQERFEESKDTSESLEMLLNKVGKKVFVDYYYILKEDDNPEVALSDTTYTLASRRSRCSTARKIFKEGLQIAALQLVIESARLGSETINKAKMIMEQESGEAYAQLSSEQLQEYVVKIGKMARGIFTTALLQGDVSEAEVSGFQDAFYCKNMFGLNYPLLKPITEKDDIDIHKRDANGYNRYYESRVSYHDEMYLICSQWVETIHRHALNQWVLSKMSRIVQNRQSTIEPQTVFGIKEILGMYWEYLSFDMRKAIDKQFQIYIEKDASIVEVGMEEGLKRYQRI